MENQLVGTSDPNYSRLLAFKNAGLSGDFWLPQDGDPDCDTLQRYVILWNDGIYWVPDITYTKA